MADNAGVSAIDREIDALYQLPLTEFTAARTALAKTLSGDAASQVRSLKKPTAVPWAINQVYWKARLVYEGLTKSGKALRDAQIAVLKGRKADVRAATDGHRRHVSEAVRRASAIAADAGLKPSAEELARMFEAVSLAATPPADTGRFTQIIAPSGFDALAGVAPARVVNAAAQAAERRKAVQEEEEKREAAARVKSATRALEHAQSRADAARKSLARAEADVAAAETELDAARRDAPKT